MFTSRQGQQPPVLTGESFSIKSQTRTIAVLVANAVFVVQEFRRQGGRFAHFRELLGI